MQKNRKGIALMAAMGGLVVIGALIAGVFFVSTQEHRIAGGTLIQERAFRAAEAGLHTTLASWDNLTMASAAPGSVTIRTYGSYGEGWIDTVRITKLNARAFSLLSTAVAGTAATGRARKQTMMNIRLTAPDFDFLGALTVRGNTQIGGSSLINGYDTNPSTWATGCPTSSGALAGIAIADSTSIGYSGCSAGACVQGSPRILQDPTAGDTSKYFRFGDEDWASLTAAATKVINGSGTFSQINPVVTNGTCDTSVQNNWGAPSHTTPAGPCENYFPIIHQKGSSGVLKLTGNKGQGILLVDGDLEISGGFEFYGPVIVRGRIKSTGTGGKLNGGVMAANVDLEQNTVLGDATITYSSCAVEKAIAASANPRRVVQRAWTEIY